MCPHITLPISFSERHGILIEDIFCKLTKTILESLTGILITQFSDHPILSSWIQNTTNYQIQKQLSCTNEALLTVKHDIHTFMIQTFITKCPNADTNFNYNLIHQIIETTKISTFQLRLFKSINIDININLDNEMFIKIN